MVHFSQSFRDFLRQSESRLAQFIYRMDREWRYSNLYNLALTNEHIDYLTLRPNGMISYMPAGKEQEFTEDGTWKREGRQEGKPSKVIRKILTKNAQKLFSDKDFEMFCNHYKAACDSENMTFEIRKDIADVYCMNRAVGDSSLSNSCMNGDRDIIKFYERIPECSVIAMLNDCGQLAGRALLWDLGKDGKFMDRIYVAKDHYYELFLDYAKEQGFIRKYRYKSYDDKMTFVRPDGTMFDETFRIRHQDDYDYYPYIDTFSYGGFGWLSNSDCEGHDYVYNCPDGEREDVEEKVWDDLNNETIYEFDAIYITRGRYSDRYINERDAVAVNCNWWWVDDEDITWVSGHGYMEKDDCTYVETRGEWVHPDNAVFCEVEEVSEHIDDVVELHDGTYTHKDNAVEIDGNYYHKNEADEIRAGLENSVE